jgi:hypothetical protein
VHANKRCSGEGVPHDGQVGVRAGVVFTLVGSAGVQ